ncbi:hypothetical protein HYV71_01190 [Candidatus Uhrbacteria bacterium]|nr:hypothetical protein [Candidatus Uhrbacteria bacterium]
MSKHDQLEESLFLGLGLTALLRGRMKAFLDFLVKEGKLAAKDQKKFRKQLIDAGEKEYGSMLREYEKYVERVMRALQDVPSNKTKAKALNKRKKSR